MSILNRLMCGIRGHDYKVARVFDATNRQLKCARCKALFGMNDRVKAVLPWDGEFEELYRSTGKWPGKVMEPT